MSLSPSGAALTGTTHKPADTGPIENNAAKRSVDISIVKSSLEVSISTKNRPLELLFQTAINKLNEILEPSLGPDAIQQVADSGIDVSPEATAQRIVDLSTGFFEAFKAQHPDEPEETALDRFLAIIGKGIDQGFSEARAILNGLEVLEGDIAANIDRTYELVQEGLTTFREGFDA